MSRRSHHGRSAGRGKRPHRAAPPRPTGLRPPAEAVDRAVVFAPAPDAAPLSVEAREGSTDPAPPTVTEATEDDTSAAIAAVGKSSLGPTVAIDRPADAGSIEAGRVTASQLRRFIRSRPYVPLHELRRRFALNGSADDMSAVDVDGQRIWVGLPEREGLLLAELLRGGDVGCELSVDPVTPVIIGVYPLRTVHRT